MRIKVFSLLFLWLCAGVFSISAQSPAKNHPFAPGETLIYEGKLSKAIFRGISVADLVFRVANSPDGKYYVLTTEATSKGSLVKLFNFRFRQTYESIVEKDSFRVMRTVKHDEQRDRVRDGEATFDYKERSVTYVETNPKDMMRPPRRIASSIRPDTLDLLSAIYNIRRLPLAVGKTFDVSVSDSGLVYTIPLHVTGRELQSSVLGKVWCFRVEPQIFGPRRYIEEEGKMIIWFTEDKSRVPVRSQIHTGMGKLEIKLKKINK
jgi:hypothetical protein